LLLATGIPQIFFSSFVWIAIVKLVSFAVFQMKIILTIYQGRYAQEISQGGWRELRSRVVNLHLRFYGILLSVFIIGSVLSVR
jgi:hypothetical protein